MKKELIVNADDFGLTRGINRAVVAAHKKGIVTSTTLLANSKHFSDAVSMSCRTPELGVGVHLNLTQGDAVALAVDVRTLVNWRGRFLRSPGWLLRGVLRHEVKLSDIERELRAQIEKVIRAGISPTHLDGHKHIHILPGISEIVIRLAAEFGIRSVRCPVQYDSDFCLLRREKAGAINRQVIKQHLVGWAVSCFASRFRKKLEMSGLLCPDHFYGLHETGFLDLVSLRHILEHMPEGVGELMCHPGYLDKDLMQAGTRLLSQREIEFRALTASEVKEFVQDRQLRLRSYRDLPESDQAVRSAA